MIINTLESRAADDVSVFVLHSSNCESTSLLIPLTHFCTEPERGMLSNCRAICESASFVRRTHKCTDCHQTASRFTGLIQSFEWLHGLSDHLAFYLAQRLFSSGGWANSIAGQKQSVCLSVNQGLPGHAPCTFPRTYSVKSPRTFLSRQIPSRTFSPLRFAPAERHSLRTAICFRS